MRVEVVGTDSLAKLIDALTSKQTCYALLVQTDALQAFRDADKRAFMVEILDEELLDNVLDTIYNSEVTE